jgi:hypothetical protein
VITERLPTLSGQLREECRDLRAIQKAHLR